MKKKLAILLSILMVGTSLAGCSLTERGYLNMNKQIAAASEYQAIGSFSCEIDFDALAVLADQAAERFMDEDAYGSEISAGNEFSKLGLTGTKKIKAHYNMIVDMKSTTAIWADFDLELDGKAYKMGDLYFDMMKGLYVSKDLLIGIYDLSRDLNPKGWDSYFYSDEYRNELLKALEGSEYVSYGILEDQNTEIAAEIETMSLYNKESYEAVYQFFESAFSGFTTGIVSQTKDGYKISLSGKQGKKLMEEMLQYLADNTGNVMDAYKEYATVTMKNMPGLTEEEKAAANDEFEEIFSQNNRILVSSYIAMAKQVFVESDKAGYIDFINGFQYEAALKKSGNKYVTLQDATLKDGKKAIFYFNSQSEIMIEQGTVVLPVFPEAKVSFDDISDAIDTIENKYNPFTTATIEWWNDDYSDNEVTISYTRSKSSPFSGYGEIDFQPYFIEASKLYIPMRSISENLGEQVAWNPNEKKAYIVRPDKQIEMTGIKKNGITYVKVKDFEKLGYTVSYEYDQEWGLHTAYISK